MVKDAEREGRRLFQRQRGVIQEGEGAEGTHGDRRMLRTWGKAGGEGEKADVRHSWVSGLKPGRMGC